MMNFTDLNGVIGQVVMDDERKAVTLCKEAEDLSVVVQELLLGSNFSATEGLFEELFHL